MEISTFKLLVIIVTLILPMQSYASKHECNTEKYSQYISITYDHYEKLTSIVNAKYPRFSDVNNHFLFTQKALLQRQLQAFHIIHNEQYETIDFSQSIEHWVTLSETDYKTLSDKHEFFKEAHTNVNTLLAAHPSPNAKMIRAATRNKFLKTTQFENLEFTYKQKILNLNNFNCTRQINEPT